ncbi:MAG: hypothetical protein HOH22_19120 [Rhodospirillaceae bacterium]|nr:hypothetical protein [Rhodospirillaceae bacterium]
MNISDENCDEIFDVICIGYGFAGAAAGGADHVAGAKFIDADPGIFTETVNRWNANVTEGRDSERLSATIMALNTPSAYAPTPRRPHP